MVNLSKSEYNFDFQRKISKIQNFKKNKNNPLIIRLKSTLNAPQRKPDNLILNLKNLKHMTPHNTSKPKTKTQADNLHINKKKNKKSQLIQHNF